MNIVDSQGVLTAQEQIELGQFVHSLLSSGARARGIHAQMHAWFPDYSGGWHRCDKELAAEDYRVLCAPPPFDSGHRLATAAAPSVSSVDGG